MSTAGFQGPTLFLGDSLTVNLPPFVSVNGPRSVMAEVGKTSDWLLGRMRALEKAGALDGPDRPVNVVVLIGTNDIGGSHTAEQIFSNASEVWSIAHAHGARVIAQTLPPVKGYAGFSSRYPEIQAKREAFNALVKASHIPDLVVPLDTLTADMDDPERLASRYDAGDHLHLQKPAHGALLTFTAQALPSAQLPTPSPSSKPVGASGGGLVVPFFVLGCVAAGTAFVLTRKPITRF